MAHWLHWLGLRLWIEALFRAFFPLAARLPMRGGIALTKMVGRVCHWLDVDWRTVALQTHYVGHRTRLAYQEIFPAWTNHALEVAVIRRFENASIEELEGHWFSLQRTKEAECTFEGLKPIHDCLLQGRGIVLLTMHFDAALMGVAKLGEAGVRLNLMTSDVVEDARVSKAVQRYFLRKYAGIEACLGGGRVLHVEQHLKAFYAGILRGECAVILGEAPTANLESALQVTLFGQRRAIAPGAIRIAEKTGAPMAAFVCLREGDGSYKVVISPVVHPERKTEYARHMQPLFDFLAARIQHAPERWWAADQLPNFITLPISERAPIASR